MTVYKSKYVQLLYIVFLVFDMVMIGYNTNLNAQDTPLYLKNKNYSIQVGMYELFVNQQADIVMLGNSLTYNANWNEILDRKNIASRGIVGDLTSGYLHRLHYVYKLKPKLCFIEGGVNDIYENIPVQEIFNNHKNIIDTLKQHNIIPVIQSALFVSPKWHHAAEKNKEIEKLNELLIDFAKKNSIMFLDINSLVSENGLLRDDLTYDGVHLNAKGYALWAPEVNKVMLMYGL